MDCLLFGIKCRRLLRRYPRTALVEFVAPMSDRGQFLAVTNAFVASYLILQTASLASAIAEVSSWILAVQAVAWTTLIWAVLCMARAPFIIVAWDRKKGKWFSRRYVYHEPHLIATVRCKATGEAQRHPILFGDAEPNAFVYYSIEVEGNPPRELFSATLSAGAMMRSYAKPGQGVSHGGLRITSERTADLVVAMRRDMVSQTFRIYCRDFSIGNPDDQDGESGVGIGR
jgi:hypothetical protein